ncbi:MAG: hypothetical protein J5721_00720 [Lachnospiraceae bacterium]|nr:hypothetical protein [Lachnospiraceae bacterium]
MDFQPQMNYVLPTGEPLPFFLAHPDHPCLRRQQPGREENAWQDFEYLRRTYPTLLSKWQRRVEEILDRMDYEGSMIYDEYPDRISLQNLGEAVARILEGMREAGEDAPESENDPQKEEYLRGLAQVLVCNEIYRRRQRRKQGTYGRITKDLGFDIR